MPWAGQAHGRGRGSLGSCLVITLGVAWAQCRVTYLPTKHTSTPPDLMALTSLNTLPDPGQFVNFNPCGKRTQACPCSSVKGKTWTGGRRRPSELPPSTARHPVVRGQGEGEG